MLSGVVLWVLIAVNSDGKAMLAQQFQSERACQQAAEFLESKRGTFVWTKCVRDEPAAKNPGAGTAPGSAAGQ